MLCTKENFFAMRKTQDPYAVCMPLKSLEDGAWGFSAVAQVLAW